MLNEHDDAWGLLRHILGTVQGNARLRKVLAATLVISLLTATSYFLYGLLPKKYMLTISGGGILTNRHHLVRVLQNEAAKSRMTLEIEPVSGSFEILKAVGEGRLDLALVQGGLDKKMPNVAHVAMLPAEIVHILVKPEIESIEDLKGKIVNMGSTGGGTKIVAESILSFFKLQKGADFIEKNYSDEELLNLHPGELPDAIFSISYVPCYIADYFVKNHGYRLLDVPYSDSLKIRYSWLEDCRVLKGTYNANPPIPEKEITAVGVELEIVANSSVDPSAISKFLEMLYTSSIENSIKQPLVEENGDSFSKYPLSAGTIAYIKRNEPIFSMEKLDNLKNLFGSAMAGLSTLMVVVRWFRGSGKREENISADKDVGA